MAGSGVIGEYLAALATRLPAPVVAELADGLHETYDGHRRRGLAADAARASVAEFGDPLTPTARAHRLGDTRWPDTTPARSTVTGTPLRGRVVIVRELLAGPRWVAASGPCPSRHESLTVHCGRSVRKCVPVTVAGRCHAPGVTRQVCDARQRKSAVIGVHDTTDSEFGIYFAEGLEHAGLTHVAPILSADANDETRFLTVTVALQNVADWKLRSQVHQVAMRVEDEHDVTVLCYFRPLDLLPFAPKHAR